MATMGEKELEVGSADALDHYGYKKDFRTALPQFIATSVKNLLLLGYGMTLGFPTILIPAVQNPREGEILHLTNSEISWIGSINLVVVPLGCALSGMVTTPIGRRRSMQVVNLPFFAAWLLLSFSTSTGYLYAALFLTGLSGGLLEAPVLTYVAEITQPHLRGALSATTSMAVITGVFTQFLLGLFLYWRTVALVNISFTILTVVSLCFIPESPHWLVSRKRFDEAKKSLEWLRGWKKSFAVDRELADVKKLYENHHNDKLKSGAESFDTLWSQVSYYLDKSFLLPFFLVSYAFFVGHFSGMTTLQMLEAPLDKYYATLVLGILQILGSGVCVLLVHYTGKRPLAFLSTIGGGVCCLLVASYDGYIRTVIDQPYFMHYLILNWLKLHPMLNLFLSSCDGSCHLLSRVSKPPKGLLTWLLLYNYLCYGIPGQTADFNVTTSNSTVPDDIGMSNPYSWMPTTFLMLLALLTHTGIRLLPWILIGEVFSARTRSGGAGLASAVGYVFGFLTNKLYITMVDYLHIYGTYGLYGIVCFTGCITFYFILPETEGKKLNDIESHFAGGRRLTNQVYRSKKKKLDLEMAKIQKLNGQVNPSFEEDFSKL